jgi:3D (Asp-Asp-Asp) domain-containing protein
MSTGVGMKNLRWLNSSQKRGMTRIKVILVAIISIAGVYLGTSYYFGFFPFTRYAIVTAYTSRVAETDNDPYITADGTNLKKIYHCVIATNDYEFGTIINIATIGDCEVVDRMADKYTGKNRIDVYMGNDLLRAKEFGKRRLKIKVE